MAQQAELRTELRTRVAEELPADAHLHKITNYSFETHFLAILQILISWLLNSLEAHMATFHTFLRYEMIIDFHCFVTLLSLFSCDVRQISMASTLGQNNARSPGLGPCLWQIRMMGKPMSLIGFQMFPHFCHFYNVVKS